MAMLQTSLCSLLVVTALVAETAGNYNTVLRKSILFYEAQRSGDLPNNNRVSWRKDSALNDGSDNGVDLTGGWYDAGDHVKFNFPMAWSVTTLAWGLIEFEDGYQAAGQLNAMYDSIKWPLDYFMKCHTSDNVLYGQVGDGHTDHGYWGRPEDMTMFRPSFKINSNNHGSDLAAETAAAMAASSIAFKNRDSGYANTLLSHAKTLYTFAKNNRGKYSDSITNARSFYNSHNGDQDEMAWAAAWLYRATGQSSYLNQAKNFYNGGVPWAFSWDDKTAGVQLLMYIVTKGNNYKNNFDNFINGWMTGSAVSYTPKGLAWRNEWGSLRYSANTAFLALVGANHGVKKSTAINWAKGQIGYMMGSSGRSYIVGYGNNPPKRPHHRAASCPAKPATCNWNDYNAAGPNPNVLQGALVGGPDANDNYADVRSDHKKNEVACDYNAGFQGAVAGLISLT